MLPAQHSGASRRLIPVYTFATLDVVGDDAERPQSGFCTYFLDSDFNAVRNPEWRTEVQSNILDARSGVQESLIAVLRALHFLEAEKQPRKQVFSPVLDPFGWLSPARSEAAGEYRVAPGNGRSGEVLLSLPALLSHIADALHRPVGAQSPTAAGKED
jgi:hypothetical protein